MPHADPAVRRAYHAEYMRRLFHENPEHRRKHLARVAVGKALRRGRLVRRPCADCGSPDSQAHHEDYGRPLDVIWLCRTCHENRHGGPGCHG